MIQPSLQPPGGGQSVCAWMLQALAGSCDLGILSWRPVDFGPIDYFFGTSLSGRRITLHRINPVLRLFVDSLPTSASLLKTAILLRSSRRIRNSYDVLMTANNEADFGRPGLQYIHYPWNNFPRPEVDLRWYHVDCALSGYYQICKALGGFSEESIKKNRTLVNSYWTAARVGESYPGIKTETVYPPVAGDFFNTPWDERENGFLCIGRISPEKKIGQMIDSVASLRAMGHAVHLHIIGTPDDDVYWKHIQRRAAAYADWIEVEQNLAREELVRRICTHRYGLHGMPDEHFGMSIAEMLAGGCIVFMPDGGGQIEIAGQCRDVLYENIDDAVRKISTVLACADEQQRLRIQLAPRREIFSAVHFMNRIRELVDDFAAQQGI